MGVPTGVWIAAAIIAIIVTWMTIWVTNKAYSRRWEDHNVENEQGKKNS
ncbi:MULTISPECIES: hypothetical protein [Paenibacillus]|uniref:Uncharacterized protein n=1 Tax=Paenibacillus lignilyticus TaxID=1172615 RepID=A0ABS5CB99_9BACL|nr:MULTISPECIES: hypothetical protein [Paenibacillus]MBP3963269.1 hypothetical protein [Paenibacillus lignilyticus]SFS62452.1 hypothetical protein SAMN05428962_1714 [Paenibacillus sp. BC26]